MNNSINTVPNLSFRATDAATNTCKIHENCNKNHKCIDLTNVYTQENIVDILREAGTYNKPVYPAKYTIAFYPDSETLVINNSNMTNDTTEISKDGRVRHCGSWHNKEIAKEQKYTDIVNDALERIKVMDKQ